MLLLTYSYLRILELTCCYLFIFSVYLQGGNNFIAHDKHLSQVYIGIMINSHAICKQFKYQIKRIKLHNESVHINMQ